MSTFQFNPNNLGGRENIAGRLFNHHKALLSAKPAINTRIPPKEHVDKNKKNKEPLKYKQLETYNTVYKTFKTIAETNQGRVDKKEPESLQFKHMNMNSKNPKLRQNKAEKFLQAEHQKRIEAEKNRIANIGSTVERKKNKFDPVANPVYLFRKEENKQDLQSDYLVNQLMPKRRTIKMSNLKMSQTIKRPGTAKSLSKSPYAQTKDLCVEDDEEFNIDDYQQQLKNDKQFYQKQEEKQRNVDFKNQQFVEDFVKEIPKTENDREEDYDFVKGALIQLIIKYRIYKKQDLDVVFQRTFIYNNKFDHEKYQAMCDDLMEQLEK